MFAKQIHCKPECGSSDESNNKVLSEFHMEQSPLPTLQPDLQGFWSLPDPGLNHQSYNDDEHEEDLIDFELLSEQEDNSDHLFLDDKAKQSDRSKNIVDICSNSEVLHLENALHAPRKEEKTAQP